RLPRPVGAADAQPGGALDRHRHTRMDDPAACHDRSVVGQQHGPPGGFGVDPDRAAASSLDPFAGQLALEALDAPGLDSDPARLGPGGELLASLRQHAASVGVRLVGAPALAAITLLPLLESPPALRHP